MVGRAKLYVLRGSASVGLLVALVNTTAIWFGLIPFIEGIFPNFFTFLACFGPIYVFVMLAYGWWEYHRGFYYYEMELAGQSTPATHDMMRCFRILSRGTDKEDEVYRLTERWLSRLPAGATDGKKIGKQVDPRRDK